MVNINYKYQIINCYLYYFEINLVDIELKNLQDRIIKESPYDLIDDRILLLFTFCCDHTSLSLSGFSLSLSLFQMQQNYQDKNKDNSDFLINNIDQQRGSKTHKNRRPLKDSARASKIRSIIRQNSLTKISKIKEMRKNISLPLYIITAFSSFLMGAENLYLFIWQIKIPWVYLASMCLRIIFFFIVGLWFVGNWKYYVKLCFCLDKVTTTGIAMITSVYALSAFMTPYANYPWLYQSLFFVYPPFILTAMTYNRILMVYCILEKWQILVYKICIVLSASSYIGVAMFFVFDPNKSLNFIHDEMADSFVAIVILYSYAGFDYHIETLAQIDDTDGTTHFRGNYQLVCDEKSMECFLYGQQILKSRTIEEI